MRKKDTAAFIKEYGITFPVLLDDTSTYPVSNAYGLTNVPTIFWIAPDGEIEISSVGWMRKEIEEFNQRAAQASAEATNRCFAETNRLRTFAPVEDRKTSPRSRAQLGCQTSDCSAMYGARIPARAAAPETLPHRARRCANSFESLTSDADRSAGPL